ncbi:uncharacterized protein PgNI_02646 [Pyricularia grisea]|uniref:Uncharacterized protein n=1 Tax=Pyricularia grisea TaxID=148305 RepID=A0A6P8BB93_PYRGI|nr:uncharacterized protein PgNI_02646 [Pyricularia grisea]TLD12967.1 hypothetical protein PgNI_02646 [Pyricularia grisea]
MPQIPTLSAQRNRVTAQATLSKMLGDNLTARINELDRAGLEIPIHDKDAFVDDADASEKIIKVDDMIKDSVETREKCDEIISRRARTLALVDAKGAALDAEIKAMPNITAPANKHQLQAAQLDCLLPVLRQVLSHEAGKKLLKTLAPELSAELGLPIQDTQAVALAEEVDQLKHDLCTRETELARASQDLATALTNVDKLERQKAQAIAHYNDIKDKYQLLKSQSTEEAESSRLLVKERDREIAKLKQDLVTRDDDLIEIGKQLAERDNQLNTTKSDLQRQIESKGRAKTEVRDLRSKLDDTRKNTAAAEADKEAANKASATANAEMEVANKKVTTLKEELAKVKRAYDADVKAHEKVLSMWRERAAKLDNTVTDLTQSKSKLNEHIDAVTFTKGALEKQTKALLDGITGSSVNKDDLHALLTALDDDLVAPTIDIQPQTWAIEVWDMPTLDPFVPAKAEGISGGFIYDEPH